MQCSEQSSKVIAQVHLFTCTRALLLQVDNSLSIDSRGPLGMSRLCLSTIAFAGMEGVQDFSASKVSCWSVAWAMLDVSEC